MGASGAVAVLCGREAKEVKEQGGDVKQFLAEKEEEYSEKFANPYQAAQFGYIDDVIEPRNTRSASAVAWLSWLIRSKTYQLRSMAVIANVIRRHSDYG